MGILIGGSPSTGSSLLRRMLNRHPAVFCGSETAMFTKAKLYTDWESGKHKLFRPSFAGLLSMGWHHLRGIHLGEEYPLSKDQVRKMALAHNDINAFATAFFNTALKKHGKTVWAEKTPANVFAFGYFSKNFKNARMIHIIRHPADAIASLVNRGMDVFNATAVYLVNTSEGLSQRKNSAVLTIKYENLVKLTRPTLELVCNFLSLEFDEIMMADKPGPGTDHMDGWRYRETGKAEAGSIGRYSELEDGARANVDYCITHLRCSLHEDLDSIQSIADMLEYDLTLTGRVDPTIKLISAIRKDRMKRRLRSAYFNQKNYPLYVR